jgi:hypothetical protein
MEEYEEGEPILTEDVVARFHNLPAGTIRQQLKRMCDSGMIVRAERGVYFKPKKNYILKKPFLSTRKIIDAMYLKKGEKTIGYITGINFSNQIGLTTQTASIETIVSNEIKGAKREKKVVNVKIELQAPRRMVTQENYKLMQVLDLFGRFDELSEFELERAAGNINNYLKDVELDKEKMEEIVDAYPLKTQVLFYKSGVFNELTRK